MEVGKNGIMQAGYIFVPYIILDAQPAVISESFNPSQSIKSRYGLLSTLNKIREKKIKKILDSFTKDI